MGFDYFDDLKDFYLPSELDAAKPKKARDQILRTLAEFKLDLKGSKLDEKQLAALPEHVLFAWKYDRDMSLSFYAIPVKKLSQPLAAAMKLVSNKCYAFHEMSLGDERAQAFVRIDAAMGLKGFEVPIEGFAGAIAKSDRACLAKYRIACFESDKKPKLKKGGLDKRFVAAHAVHRAS